MRWHPLVLILVLAACSKDGEKDTAPDDAIPDGGGDADTDADSDADVDCEASVVSIVPEDGDNLVPLDAEVTATFDAAITDAAPFGIEVGTASGTTSLAADGLSMTWTGTLEPETSYTVTASACDSSLSSEFTTLPLPLDLGELDGNTYALPWTTIVISEPGNAALLNTFIDVPFVLAQIVSVDTTSLLAEAVGTTGSEDISGNPVPDCANAVLQTADFTLNPYFRIDGTIAIPIDANGGTTNIEEFSLLAKMSEDGASISDVRISGVIATEDILPDNDCVNGPLIQLLDPTCVPCTASPTGQCLLFEGTAPLALLQPTIDIATTCGLN